MRALRPILALVFLFAVQATAAGWRQCPHHDQLAPEHGAPAAVQHNGHGADVPATPEHNDGPCSCLSGAQCAVAVALPASAGAHLSVATTETWSAALPLEHQAPARVPGLYLPEATAPPATL